MEDQVDSPGVVLHVQPVADVLTLAIDRQRFPMTDVIDKQRNKLLRELVRAVVVGAVRDDGRHPERVMEGTHKVVRAGFGGAVRAVRLILQVLREELLAIGQMVLPAGSLGRERRLDTLRMRHLQGAIDFVGGDVVEAAGNRSVKDIALGLPVRLGGLQHGQSAHDVGAGEGEGIFDGAVHMGLGGQVDDAVHPFLLHEGQDALEIADVHPDEPVIGLVLDVPEVREVARIGELVQIDDPVVRVFIDQQPDHMAADETGSAGDNDGSIVIHGGKDDVCLFRKGGRPRRGSASRCPVRDRSRRRRLRRRDNRGCRTCIGRRLLRRGR